MKYNTLAELADAYKTGKLSREFGDILWLDNDTVFLYAGAQKVFDSDPHWVMEEALELLGIPAESV